MSASAAMSPVSDDVKMSVEMGDKPVSALTPPTSEEMNHEPKKEQEDSDLSDLDMDDDDDEEIFPDHYWDEENGGRIPVFKPTMDQFRSFKKFVDKIDRYGMKSGIVKVIPPPEWRNSLPALDEYVKRIRIKNPITQEFNGTFGTYTQQNVEKQRSYNLPEWKALTEETQHQHPAKRGERRRNQEKVVRGGGNLRGRVSTGATSQPEESPKTRKKPGRPRRTPLANDEHAASEEDSPQVKRLKTEDANVETSSSPDKPAKRPRGRPPAKGGQAKSVTSRRLNNTAEAVDCIDEQAFKDFDYRMDGLEEYTPERCAELESHYWKSLGFNQPMYAADMPGSLFDDTVKSWNVAKLENLLDVLGTKVPGVNTAYLYMGMWKATFAWHLEDVDLYSINYIHFGAPKQWYSISQEDARKFERAMKNVWPGDAKACDQFLRHKTYLISPDVLQKQYGVKVNKLVHYEGEFVITYPYGYHSGYNIGYNCAESVNFATESWLEYGRIARKCNCEADNVWVDVQEIERKLRGEPTPEYYEETDDEDEDGEDEEDGNLPTPPPSVKGAKGKGRKRKRETKQDAQKKKKRRIRIKIRVPTREPCVMCPNDNPWEPLLPTDTGKKAHRSCALYTPETFVAIREGIETVCGVANIDKARLELKCNFCRSKRGACFQCNSSKCTRAFHATCAVAAGVLVDAGHVPTFDEDGTEYYEEGYDFRCRYHRPRMSKNPNVDAMEKVKRVMNHAKDLKPNDTVQAQLIGGEVFGGLVVENRPSEMMLIVDVLPDGNRIEIDWKYICVLDPDDSVRPKPSAGARPMPQDMNKSNFSASNRQDGVPTQGELFNGTDETLKWHDFYNLHTPPPGYHTVQHQAPCVLKVDVSKPEQVFYYLPKISSDAKSFYTDKPGSDLAIGAANFMDRVSAAHRNSFHQFSNNVGKQAIAPASRSNGAGYVPYHAPAATATSTSTFNARPYIYKPKEPVRPSVVNPQALQRPQGSVEDMNQRQSPGSFPALQQQSLTQPFPTLETTPNPPPLRSFPSEQYYSAKVLPAAYQGEYSAFRRASQGAQTMPKLMSVDNTGYNSSSYQSAAHSRVHSTHSTPPVTVMTGPPMEHLAPSTSSRSNPPSRPSSSAHSHASIAPSTPASTIASLSKGNNGIQADPGYMQNLQKFPHLLDSFQRRPKMTDDEQPPTLHESTSDGAVVKIEPVDTEDLPRRASLQWTPPSQRLDPLEERQTPPPPISAHVLTGPLSYKRPGSNGSQDFHFYGRPRMTSTASRDSGLITYPMTNFAAKNTNLQTNTDHIGFGASLDSIKMWTSPRGPTPSPISDPKTPGLAHANSPSMLDADWSNMLVDSAGVDGFDAIYGPMLPQMDANGDAWRFG